MSRKQHPAVAAPVDVLEQMETLTARAGSVAAVHRHDDGDVISVRDREGRLLFELHEDSGRVVITVAEGDLELRSVKGKVRIAAREGVEIDGGELLTLKARRLRQVVGVLETRARRILEKAHDVYRDVEGLSQLKSGDVRIVAKQTIRALAERLRLNAKKDVAVDGEKIYLG